ncbi:mitochondrial outer membrane protein [Paramyrothecium foliicola]|nr:mitochondrial outer membrane protein [Paramyrothecium foliicola]
MSNSVFLSVAPYHILSYGTLLGTTFFHSFINGPVMFKTVTRAVFSSVQTNLFPIYFGLQTAVPVVLALTFPGSTLLGLPSGITGLLDGAVRWNSLVPIATTFFTGLINLLFLLPATQQVMKDRRGQVKRDGKEWYAEGPHSEEMQALNKKFGVLHGVSSLLNLGTLVSLIAYGFTLGARIQPLA